MLDLHRLRLLREVHVRGTIHAAAGALGYTPSAVSQQLAVLEREAGARLLERVGRNVRLTEAGHVLVGHADTLLEGAEAAAAEVAAVAAGRLEGTVRVSAFQSAFLRVVAPTIRDLADEHPGIRVEATELEVEQAVPALRLHQLDVLVGDEYEEQPRALHPELRRETVLREPINVVLPADHPRAADTHVSLADLADLPWAACQPGTGHHAMHLRACRQVGGFEPDVRHTSDDFLILLELVRTTGAGALLPELVLGLGAPGVVVRPLEAPVGREVFLLTRRSRTPTVEAVTHALLAAGRAAIS
ncbi:LysR family transcriptional regulator [Nocardioides marmoribigeumensis]|uniref:DNA-binding transcriptional LysR family regulator n=1 Tax=Nocardioides marmoribigeumensis TaxID=433649 RepID=A0ABU2C0J2_9ACTN|nr:LysR family transcriptional regulator [Nocardioides marmoribigeumensis]MDR7364184.1 DNA-binding transcriptional LysR family regulator [Nocardioides marmoribigeumensis]